MSGFMSELFRQLDEGRVFKVVLDAFLGRIHSTWPQSIKVLGVVRDLVMFSVDFICRSRTKSERKNGSLIRPVKISTNSR
jgi:hypothetical protein